MDLATSIAVWPIVSTKPRSSLRVSDLSISLLGGACRYGFGHCWLPGENRGGLGLPKKTTSGTAFSGFPMLKLCTD